MTDKTPKIEGIPDSVVREFLQDLEGLDDLTKMEMINDFINNSLNTSN